MLTSKDKNYVIENDTRRLTFTIDDFCTTMALTAAKHAKVAPALLNQYAAKAKHTYLPLAEYLLEYQAEHLEKAEVSQIIVP